MAQLAPMIIYVYWAFALVIGFVFFRKDIISFNKEYDSRRIMLLVFSILIVAVNAYVYSHSTTNGGRPIDPLSVVIFSIGNGVAETFYFYAFFRLGETLVGKFTTNQWAKFIVGFICFMIYSGIIHARFWLPILPEHIVQTSPLKPFFMPVQIMIATSWALSFFWYRDLRTVVILHALVDLTMILSVRFSVIG